uniref:Trichoplein keratin filament-binding protein n=1 Tax=Mola mola TaxID=94237 RepID=A0A3Q3XC44_MOLML
MALPTFSARTPSRSRVLAAQLARQREHDARWRQQWELHAQYFREQSAHSQRQAVWSSTHSYQRSMSAYQRETVKEEKRVALERRRDRLRVVLQEEQDRLEAELKELVPDRSTLVRQLVKKNVELHTVKEERRKKVRYFPVSNARLFSVESSLHKDHVVSQWQDQISEKEQEEKRRFENEYERTRKEALERMKQAEEKKNAEERKRAEELRQQMEELKLREEEASQLEKEQEALQAKQWELEKIQEERRAAEERRKKSELGYFLIRQYRAQLKQRAQRVQEELEADRKILAALLEGEDADKNLEMARRERAIADAAWMKGVIEEQLQLERQREAEFDVLHRQEAQHVWEKREAQWEKERKARQRLMREVFAGRQQQLELKMQKNREAQEESLRRREELVQELELEREIRRRMKEQQMGQRTARMQEINAQVEQKRQEQREEQCRVEQEEEEDRETLCIQEEELRLEMERMAQKGHQEKIYSRPRSAWT